MIETIGWISAACFALCGLPQAIKSYKDGNSDGIAALMLWLWTIGEVLAIWYVLGKHGMDLPLLTNYVVNLIFLTIILRYKYYTR
jgi:uncharacterized protein with PQ loop repeat